jgi:amino acid adenylation domain-containing protein
VTADERARVLDAFNRTDVAIEPESVVMRFERQVRRTPEAPAIRFEGTTLSYRALNESANRLANHLRRLGAAPGVLVAVCIHRSPDLVTALLAVQKTGAAYIPLDPYFPADRLSYMIDDSAARVLVTAGDAADGLSLPADVKVVHLDHEAQMLQSMAADDLGQPWRPQDPAYVIYTSGSTGRPKGVVISTGALVNFLASMQAEPGLSAYDVVLAVTTVSFDIAALELYLPLIVGARIELVSRETATDGTELAGVLTTSGATMLQATPATWRLLIEAGWRGGARFRALCGGEALSPDLAVALHGRVGQLWNMYGPTETTVWSTVERVAVGEDAITIGRPIANTQIYVLDAAGEPAPIGITGEICIGGQGVAIGYHGRPELTAEKFVTDRFRPGPGARIYRTGDLGRWRHDGRLEHLGRRDHQVKIRGFRIELGEIETVLATHEAIRQAVVVAREAGADDLRLVAYVVYAPGQDLTVSDVRRHLRQLLPDYMVPSVILAVDAIPLTPNGKVDRAGLPDPFKGAQRAAGTFEPPAPGTEQVLADIWCDVLKVGRVGAEDNFFELGGHSLLSFRVAEDVNKRMGWRMDPRTLFFQTLRQVAALGDAAMATGAAAGLSRQT